MGELEASNRRMKEEIAGRDAQLERMSSNVEHAEKLKLSFEDLKAR